MKSSFLSVVIPSYNCADLLERSVSSAFALGVDRVEVVIVDDGSTDSTQDVCRRLCSDNPTLKVIHRTNGGLSAARNTGIRACTGDFVLLLDADDELLKFDPQLVAEINVDVLRIGVEDVHIDGTTTSHTDSAPAQRGCIYLHECLTQNNGRSFRIESWAYIYRRGYIVNERLEFPEGLLHEDTRFTIEALLKAASVAAIATPVYRYIRRAASIMGTHSFAMSRRRITSFSAIHARILDMANVNRDVDLWLWAEHLVDVAWRYACSEGSRRLAFAVLEMEWRLFTGYQLWGLYRTRKESRYRLRLAVERVLFGPSKRRPRGPHD